MVQKTYLKTKDYCKVKFSLTDENADTVEIFGLNSDWDNPVVMSKKKNGVFSIELTLPKNSEHEFKYRINGTEWIHDTDADREIKNEFGSVNSVLVL
jgi:nitrogen fixation protein FixH